MVAREVIARKETICDTVEIRGWCELSEELLGIGCDSRDAYVDREVRVRIMECCDGLRVGGERWMNGWNRMRLRDGIRARIPRSVGNVFIEPRLGLDGDCNALKILVAGPGSQI